MDEFARTRTDDDLFEDGFSPILRPEVSSCVPSDPFDNGEGPEQRRRRSARGKGMRVRGSRGPGKNSTDANAPPTTSDVASGGENVPPVAVEEARPSAVKGDRSGTGGVKIVSMNLIETDAEMIVEDTRELYIC